MSELMAVREPGRHLRCPYCEAYEVERLYLASLRVDSCACASCSARWDEDTQTGEFRGRAPKENIEIGPRGQGGARS